eukprot:133348_1
MEEIKISIEKEEEKKKKKKGKRSKKKGKGKRKEIEGKEKIEVDKEAEKIIEIEYQKDDKNIVFEDKKENEKIRVSEPNFQKKEKKSVKKYTIIKKKIIK